MKVTEILAQLKAGFQEEVNEATAKLDVVAEGETSLKAEILEAETRGYDQGIKDAGGVGADDKIYSQAQFDQYLAEALAPLQEAQAASDLKIADLQGKVDAAPAEKDAAVEAMKADLLAEYESAQVAETDSETGFRSKLAPKVVAPE